MSQKGNEKKKKTNNTVKNQKKNKIKSTECQSIIIRIVILDNNRKDNRRSMLGQLERII